MDKEIFVDLFIHSLGKTDSTVYFVPWTVLSSWDSKQEKKTFFIPYQANNLIGKAINKWMYS